MISDQRTVKAVQVFIHRNHAELSAFARSGLAEAGRGAVVLSLEKVAAGASDLTTAGARYVAAGDANALGKGELQARGVSALVARYDAGAAMVVAVVDAEGETTAYPIALAR